MKKKNEKPRLHLNCKDRIKMNPWDKFYKLTFLRETRIWNRRAWIFKCECWKLTEVQLALARNWNTKSCGCLKRKEDSISRHRLYATYNGIVSRCTRENTESYKRYWWRGIKCEWESMKEFISDMYPTYKEWLQIDRIDNNWNYNKENCKWSTRYEQNRNRRSNIMVWDKCLWDYCKEHNLKYVTIQSRVTNLGWSLTEALVTPTRMLSKSK